MRNISIEERAINLAQYIIDTGDTVRGAAKKFGVSKSTVHMDVTQKNGKLKQSKTNVGETCGRPHLEGHTLNTIPDKIEIKGVFLSKKNPIVKLGIVVK